MGRPKQFDVERALDEATNLFWSKGYAETSVSDLEEGLDLGRQSIYGAFGDKRELFLKSLDRYLEGQPSHRANLWRDDVGLAEIREFLAGIVAFVAGESGRSCFLVNTALSNDGDSAVQERCRRNQDHLRASLANALRGAIRRGEIAPEADVDATALLLTAMVFGVNVMARNGTDAEALGATFEAALGAL